MSKKRVLTWELAGVLVIVILGSALHFLFEWTGHWRPVAWLASVNESTWEHFKLAFWPGLLYALVEYRAIKGVANNFWAAKGFGLMSMPVVIGVLFYGYTAVLGENYLTADILIFLLSVVVGQMISYKILTAGKVKAVARWGGVVGLIVIVAAFSVLSYYPPRAFLFEDPETNQYGIIETHAEHK